MTHLSSLIFISKQREAVQTMLSLLAILLRPVLGIQSDGSCTIVKTSNDPEHFQRNEFSK